MRHRERHLDLLDRRGLLLDDLFLFDLGGGFLRHLLVRGDLVHLGPRRLRHRQEAETIRRYISYKLEPLWDSGHMARDDFDALKANFWRMRDKVFGPLSKSDEPGVGKRNKSQVARDDGGKA
jgi:hypothetical protein